MQSLMVKRKRTRPWAVLFIAAFIILCVTHASSQAKPSQVATIHLQFADFDPLAENPILFASKQPLERLRGESLFLVQFVGPVRQDWKTSLENAGARLYGYIPDYTFLARMEAEEAWRVSRFSFVRWVGQYQPIYRLASTLRETQFTSDSPPIRFNVQALPDLDLERLLAEIHSIGGTLESQVSNIFASYLTVVLPGDQLAALAGFDGVLWVEPYFQQELQNNIGGGAIMKAESVRAVSGLFGEGQVVAVADSGLDVGTTGLEMSADFSGRILAGQPLCADMGLRDTWSDLNGHGTHVSGSVLGNGVLSGSQPANHHYDNSFAGVAPEAQLVMQAIDSDSDGTLECIPYDLLTGLFAKAYDLGARLHSNSWGGPSGWQGNPFGGYTTKASQVDQAAWTYKDMLILFAAGNYATDANGDGKVDLDSLTSPGTAKNTLTIGASENNRPYVSTTWGEAWALDFPADPIHSDPLANNTAGMAAFSGRGPTDDGRVKPDLVAPGTMIISSRSHLPNTSTGWGVYNADYYYNGGTSMATPLTAGAAALAREWLTKLQGVVDPSAALLKAVLINGATNMTPGQYASPQEIPAQMPNNVSGWGRVDLAESLGPPAPRQIWLQDNTYGIYTGETITSMLSTGISEEGLPGHPAIDRTEVVPPAATSEPTPAPSPSPPPSPTPLPLTAGGPLRVTLVWTDYPAIPSASKVLVNDLDLEVIAPDGSHYYGNAGLYTSGKCLRASRWDACNNVEGVTIPAAYNGNYQIIVHAANVPYGPQPYAVVASGDYLVSAWTPPFYNNLLLPIVIRQP